MGYSSGHYPVLPSPHVISGKTPPFFELPRGMECPSSWRLSSIPQHPANLLLGNEGSAQWPWQGAWARGPFSWGSDVTKINQGCLLGHGRHHQPITVLRLGSAEMVGDSLEGRLSRRAQNPRKKPSAPVSFLRAVLHSRLH